VSLLIGLFLGPHLRTLPLPLNVLVVSALIVTCLTWLIMPALTRLLHVWLHPRPASSKVTPQRTN
jgi:antibiotic biosynthesis monooxygenase (ABM) superfamily enzyme